MLQLLITIYQFITLTVYLKDESEVVRCYLLRHRLDRDFIRHDVTVVQVVKEIFIYQHDCLKETFPLFIRLSKSHEVFRRHFCRQPDTVVAQVELIAVSIHATCVDIDDIDVFGMTLSNIRRRLDIFREMDVLPSHRTQTLVLYL